MKKRRSARRRGHPRELALAYLGARSLDDVSMRSIVDRHIVRVLDAADGNLSVAADLLGINRRTMQRYARRRASRI
jgi:ActR/RegA family two-component response regulator